MTPSREDEPQALIEHLAELRLRLIHSFIGVFVGFLACWSVSEFIFDIIRQPIAPYLTQGGLVFTAPMDKFLAHIKISVLASIIVTCPYWLFQVWKFISPALYREEKRYAYVFICMGSLLFLAGVSFVYFVVYPMAFEFLMTFGGGTDQPMITIERYLSFFITTTLVFGLAFEMPLILSVLGVIGLIDSQFLKEKRRYAIVILAALSAVVTPPDVISMLLMMAPMLLLYELSIFMVGVMPGTKR